MTRRFEQALAAELAGGNHETIGFVALSLQRAYTALESLLERLVRFFDGSVPSGPAWHRTLLQRAGLEIEAIRPALLAPETLVPLAELLRFRHFLHHDYDAEIDANKLNDMVAQVRGLLPLLDRDLDVVDAWLAALAVG